MSSRLACFFLPLSLIACGPGDENGDDTSATETDPCLEEAFAAENFEACCAEDAGYEVEGHYDICDAVRPLDNSSGSCPIADPYDAVICLESVEWEKVDGDSCYRGKGSERMGKTTTSTLADCATYAAENGWTGEGYMLSWSPDKSKCKVYQSTAEGAADSSGFYSYVSVGSGQDDDGDGYRVCDDDCDDDDATVNPGAT